MAKIALDLDGVLVEWNVPFAQLLETITGREIPRPEGWPTVWDWPSAAGATPAEQAAAWDWIRENEDWWFYLPPTDEAVMEASRIAQLVDDHEVIVLTNRPTGMNASNAWVLAAFGVIIPVIRVKGPKGPTADRLGVEVLVDDRPENLLNTKARQILIDRPWNQTADWGERMGLTQFLNEMLPQDGLITTYPQISGEPR